MSDPDPDAPTDPTTAFELSPTWDYQDLRSLLIATFGYQYGPTPEERIDEIRRDRDRRAIWIRRRLSLSPKHVIADIGSGCGFFARAMAPHVEHVHCVDISAGFLDYCRVELRDFDNVSFSLIEYARFADLEDGSLDAAYSTAVFIHFNYYDFEHYLRELWRVLRPGGRFWFNFLNADILDVADPVYRTHSDEYLVQRENRVFNVVHPFSEVALKRLLPQIGFLLASLDYDRNTSNTSAVVVKPA